MTNWFPAAFGLNAYGLTVLLIFCGLAGETTLAAELGIAQSATLALFYGFSANVRSLVLRAPSGSLVRSLLVYRLYLLLPLSLAAYYLSASLGSAGLIVSVAVILRRCSEWLSELQLSKGEMAGDYVLAERYGVTQAGFLVAVIAMVALFPTAAPYAMLVWAVSPLPLSLGFLSGTMRSSEISAFPWREISPNFGSTAIIGIAAYIFRLILLLLAGKDTAGDLFTAFAIGGLVSSLYVSVFGPTLVLGEQRGVRHSFARWVSLAAWAQLSAGVALLVVYATNFSLFEIAGKSLFFAGAAGASLIGGTLMLQAQKIRLRLIQADGLNDLFGPDVLMNVSMLGSALLAFYAAGERALPFLYFWNSVLALLFYYSAKAEACRERAGAAAAGSATVFGIKILVYLLLIAPVFFQLGHGLFIDPLKQPYFDSLGVFTDLPLPVSILACFLGILVFGGYDRSLLSLLVIFSTFSLMFISAIFSANGNVSGAVPKILLMIQFILPFFGLVLGQSASRAYGESKLIQKSFFSAVFVVSILQILFTVYQGNGRLTSYLYVFSVYQHLQYVPTIFAAVYVLGIFSLFEEKRFKPLILVMSVSMPLYSIMATSMTALGLCIIGPLAYLFVSSKGARFVRLGMISLSLATIIGAFYYFSDAYVMRYKFTFLDPEFSSMSLKRKLPNIDDRLKYWKVYGRAIVSDGNTSLWGHNEPLPRAQFPSAHNYALDFVYNFGFITFLPLLLLFVYTVRGVWRRRNLLPSDMDFAGLAFVVLFLLLVDNSLKVGLRQPYPGILTFFAWGILLSRLGGAAVRTSARQAPAVARPMRVAVLNLTASGISGGYKKYLSNILPRLAASPDTESLVCFSPAEFRIEEWVAPHQKLRFRPCRPFGPFRKRLHPEEEAELASYSPDVIFVPVARDVEIDGAKIVTMVQNMAPLADSAAGPGLKERIKFYLQKLETLSAVEKAQAVIAPTSFVKDSLIKAAGLNPDKIRVIPFGSNQPVDKSARPAVLPAGFSGSFIFTAGSVERYRGLEDLLLLMGKGDRFLEGVRLLVAGGARPGTSEYFTQLRQLMPANIAENSVFWLGNLSQEELAWCYANCSAFIATSRVESFCFVALEAMSYGCNVVSTDSPCLPEVFGMAAEYYKAGDIDGLSNAVSKVISRSPQERARFASLARETAGNYSWDSAAAQLIALLRSLSATGGSPRQP